MANCKIVYKNDKGFWIAESFSQLFMHYIYKELQKPQYIFSNKQELLEDLEDNINGYCNGYIGLNWEGLMSSAEEQTMIQVLQNVKISLQNKGASISVAELKSIPTEDIHFQYILDKKPFPTSELIRVINALIQMLQGTWTSTNYEMDLNWRYNS
ncbi:MAG: hypothetical protein ACN6OB_00510 [Chryseobacterium jejuense]|uniref:hypothetical protein n=1 Tax=Chryseobacterium jejuense TaxID=445960 RepID=UPI003D09827B